MRTINAETIGEGHEKVVRLIMTEDANDIFTEDKELTFEHPEPVNIHIKHPFMEPMSSPALQFGELSLNEYVKQMMKTKILVDKYGAPAFSYIYSNLAFDWPMGKPFPVDFEGKFMRMDWPIGNGRGDGINQIAYVVNKLSKNPTSRRAVVSLFSPEGHPAMDDPPCLNHIQFMIRNGELNCHALFRSNDMLSAWGDNAYALAYLQDYVRNGIKLAIGDRFDSLESLKLGYLETTSISAHIYWKRDQKELEEFKKRWC